MRLCVACTHKKTKNTVEFKNLFVLTGQSLFGLLNQNSERTIEEMHTENAGSEIFLQNIGRTELQYK